MTSANATSTEATKSEDSQTSTDTSTTNSTDTSSVSVESKYKNKQAALIAMTENIRKTYTFSLKLPGEFKHLHSNSFCMLMTSSKFKAENMPNIGRKMNGKFIRYLGFEENRYYIEGVTVSYTQNGGLYTELKLNPFASGYSDYAKKQMEAYNALQSALGSNSSTGSTGGNLGNDAISVGNSLGSKYKFARGGCSSYSCMQSSGSGDCWAWSDALYTELTKIGYTCRIIQYGTSSSPRHRSVQYKDSSGNWVDYPYSQTSIPRMAKATSSKPGMKVVQGG